MTMSWLQCHSSWFTALPGLLWGARNLPTARQKEQQTGRLGHPAMMKWTAPLSRHSIHHPQDIFLSPWPHAKEWSQIYCFYFSPTKILSNHFYSAIHSSIPNLVLAPLLASQWQISWSCICNWDSASGRTQSTQSNNTVYTEEPSAA